MNPFGGTPQQGAAVCWLSSNTIIADTHYQTHYACCCPEKKMTCQLFFLTLPRLMLHKDSPFARCTVPFVKTPAASVLPQKASAFPSLYELSSDVSPIF